MNRTFTVLFLLAIHATPIALAQPSAGPSRARQRVTPYRAASVDVIAELGAAIPSTIRRSDVLELRFIRAIAAADLVLLDHIGYGPVDSDDVAAAFGAHPDELLETIHQELSEIATGPYLDECTDAMRAIETMEGGEPQWPADSSRGDILRVLELAERADAADPVRAFALLGDDPCARGNCGEPHRAFDEQGRRAIQTVEGAFEALERARERARTEGSPLARALGGVVDALWERFASIRLYPQPAWNGLIPAPTIVADASGSSTVHQVLHVDPDAVYWIERPWVRFVDGRSELVAERQRVEMPSNRRAYVTAIPEVVELMRGRDIEGAVALSANPRVEALTLWQVLASAERADVLVDRLAVVDESGGLHTRRFRTQDSFDHETAEVFVRLGGYSIRMGSQNVAVPRQMVDGGWEHDREALRSTLADARAESIAFKSMGIAPADLLLGAVFTPNVRVATLVRR